MKTGLPWRMLAPDNRQVAIWNKWLIAVRKTPCEATEFTDVGLTDLFRLDGRPPLPWRERDHSLPLLPRISGACAKITHRSQQKQSRCSATLIKLAVHVTLTENPTERSRTTRPPRSTTNWAPKCLSLSRDARQFVTCSKRSPLCPQSKGAPRPRCCRRWERLSSLRFGQWGSITD
jgi:hypothetical protein